MPSEPGRRPLPVSLLAAALAVALTVGWLQHRAASTQRWAGRYVQALGPVYLNQFKFETLTLQRAALAQQDILPLYGTSEIYCCGQPYNAAHFYTHAPTGFAVFAVGHYVTRDLFWAITFGALGTALRGKKLVVSDSPWFFGDISTTDYVHTFSPEVATTFAFDAPLPFALRSQIAFRMLSFPSTLKGRPLLTAALRDEASNDRRGRLAFWLLDPIGRLAAWHLQMIDVAQTRLLLRRFAGAPPPAPPGPLTPVWTRLQALLRRLGLEKPLWQQLESAAKYYSGGYLNPNVPVEPGAINWNAQLTAATAMAARLTADNPFGVDPSRWKGCGDIQPVGGHLCQSAVQLYKAGRTNHAGTVYPLPTSFVQGAENCTCWTDLDLEFEVLRAVQARPLAWLQPLQGDLDDHTPYSAQARRVIYDRWMAIAKAEGIPGTTFQTHDTDPLFVNSFGHFSQRGWVYADRLINLFWHGQLGQVRGEMAVGGSVDRLFPASLNCPITAWCEGVDDVPALPGELAYLPVGLGLPLPSSAAAAS